MENQPGIPPNIKGLPPEAAGLLAEFQSADEKDRTLLERSAREAVGGLQLLEPGRFTHDAEEQALLWKIRQGLYPSVGAARKRGTTVSIEDVVFPIDSLADATVRRPRWTGTRGSWTTWSAWWCGSMTGRSRASMGLGATWYDERWCG